MSDEKDEDLGTLAEAEKRGCRESMQGGMREMGAGVRGGCPLCSSCFFTNAGDNRLG